MIHLTSAIGSQVTSAGGVVLRCSSAKRAGSSTRIQDLLTRSRSIDWATAPQHFDVNINLDKTDFWDNFRETPVKNISS